MKKQLYFASIALTVCLLHACSPSHEKTASHETAEMADSAAAADEEISSEAETDASASNSKKSVNTDPDNSDFQISSQTGVEKTNRKFVRTADVKCKVKNVRQATDLIEDITAVHQGFIVHSNLQTSVERSESVPISADSTLETRTYTVENDVLLRVPNYKLDGLLRELNSLVDFLDYRVIKAEDAGLSLLAGQMRSQRLKDYERRTIQKIDNQGRKLRETINAEDNLLDKQNQLDEQKLQTLQLEDQIAYSTVHLRIYQRESVFSEVVANARPTQTYRPGFAGRLGESLVEGWYIMEEILVFIARLWLVLLVGIGLYILYQRYSKRLKPRPIVTEE